MRKGKWAFILPTFLGNVHSLAEEQMTLPVSLSLSSISPAWLTSSGFWTVFSLLGFPYNCYSLVHGCKLPPKPRLGTGAPDYTISKNPLNCIKHKNWTQTSSLKKRKNMYRFLKSEGKMTYSLAHPVVTLVPWGEQASQEESKKLTWKLEGLFWILPPPIKTQSKLWSQIQGKFPGI